LGIADGASNLLLLVIALVVASAVAVSLGLAIAGRLDLSRSVLVHAPTSRAWEFIRHYPTLHARHGKARDLCQINEWMLRRGQGEDAGTVWRALGTWGGAEYWADVEIIRVDPGKELAISLRRDSLGTHRGLRGHLGSLSLEAVAPDTTKLTWRLRARLRGPRLILERLVACPRLQARLLDQGLRSLKVEIDDDALQAVDDAPRPADRPGAVTATPPPSVRMPPETTA